MIICHGSDWHGCQYKIPLDISGKNYEVVTLFPKIDKDFDVFVMTGDFLPNKIWGANRNKHKLEKEKHFQADWLRKQAKSLQECIKNKPFLFCGGNHDFINPCRILQECGINAIDLTDKVVDFMGFTWYGFPYIPVMEYNWNYEKNLEQMQYEGSMMINRLKDSNKLDSLDIIAAHCPLHGILDKASNENIGNSVMNSLVSYKLPRLPKLYLCGHNHEDGGKFTYLNGLDRTTESMFISNAATTYRIIDLDNMPACA